MKQIALDLRLGGAPSFTNFVPGANEGALRHLQLWAGDGKSGPRSPVPIYLWGPQGSGKTHLLRAARDVLTGQGASCGWIDASVTEPPPYDERWSAVLLDDVGQYSAVQQHAAFNWFVHAQAAHATVLAAGDVPPADLKLREDLRTRLGWGHVFGLEPLDEVERTQVLRQAAQARGLVLSDDVIAFMLTRFARDLGSLMALLDELDVYSLREKRPITIPLLKDMLQDSFL